MGRAKPADKSANDAKTLERISEAVEKLRSEVEALRGIIGRLQDEVAWALDHDTFRRAKLRGEPAFPMPITSMPRNPLASDFGKRLNRFRPEDLPDDEDEHGESDELVQRDLFSE